MFEQMAILAPGLLGASLGMAARERGLARRVVVWARRAEARAQCDGLPWCAGAFAEPEAAVREADVAVLCAPVDAIVALVERVAAAVREDALVTDVGSTKSRICRGAAARLGVRYVGSHPMAGSEQSGLEHARGDLFEGRPCLVTPLEETPEGQTAATVRLWQGLGMRVTTMSPEQHDEIVAAISHVPHLAATALARVLAGKERGWRSFVGAGFLDTTRVAAGHAGLWRGILEQNREEILRALSDYESSLGDIQRALTNENYAEVEQLLAEGKRCRDSLG